MTNSDHELPSTPSPWHAGERLLQMRMGVAERMEQFGRKVIRDFMPEQHRLFYAQLPFVVAATVDDAGAVWASLLSGDPGFAHSPDPRQLRIDASIDSSNPIAAGLGVAAPIGLLGIELSTRRRNRLNGSIIAADAAGFTVQVVQAFGNCPKYIQTRDFAGRSETVSVAPAVAERGNGLDARAAAIIANADTFFVASYVDTDGDVTQRAVDVSHRGGKPGFVRIDGDVLTIPDFTGNLHFNTLGNFLLNPRAGLVFVDFDQGDLLHVTGRTEIIFDGDEVRSFEGAERLWRLHVAQRVFRRGALPMRWRFGTASPNALMTGSWVYAGAGHRVGRSHQK